MTTFDELIINNQGLVYPVAHKFKPTLAFYRASFEDAVSEGMVGLVKAAKKFEPERGFAFATFATMVITNEILQFLRKLRKHNTYSFVSIDTPIESVNGDEFHFEIADLRDHFEMSEQRMVFEQVVIKLKPQDVKMALEYFGGKKQKDLAKEFGLSQSLISRRVSRTINRARELARA